MRAGHHTGQYLTFEEPVELDGALQGWRWTVVVRQPLAHAYAPIDDTRRDLMLFMPVAAVLLGLATWLVAGRLVRPVVRLADAARQAVSTTGHVLDQDLTSGRNVTGLLDQTLSRLALTDPLTGLGNRNALKQHLQVLQQRLQQAPGRAAHAVMLINLDDFHLVNNTQGHEVGDVLLRAVAVRLQGLSAGDAFLARLGGDECVMVVSGLPVDGQTRVTARAQTILDAFGAPLYIDTGSTTCPVSIGICLVDTAALPIEDALTHAEVAMQEAKRLGKKRVAWFDALLQQRLIEQVRFEQQLRDAIPSQLQVLYQAQVNRERHITGAELLVRWAHPEQGVVSPGHFIPLAEQTKLILPIGRWVLEQACLQLQRWQDVPVCQDWVLAVNVSAHEFNQPDYVEQVRNTVQRCGANPERLKLELTESALAVDVLEVVAKMNALKAIGITFALDDFGTGFSSLSYLKRMPIHLLKIDQSFVQDVLYEERSISIVRAVVALGNSMGLEVIAEGVETEEQCQRLAALGCHNYQGYLFGQPGPVEELLRAVSVGEFPQPPAQSAA